MSDEVKIKHVTVKALGIPIRVVPGQPVNRVENILIWPDGISRAMTRRERLIMWLRLPLTVERPSQEAVMLQRFVHNRLDHALLHGQPTSQREEVR